MGIELLPGARLSPDVLLHQVLEDAEQFKGVLVVTLDKDDMMQVFWSQMPMAFLAMAAMVVDAKVREAVLNQDS